MRSWVVWALACAACGDSAAPPSDAAPQVSYDVVVVGAGPGGVAAAIAAARHHATVLLVEPTGWIGGQMASVPAIEDAVDVGIASTLRTGFADELRRAEIAHYAALGLSVEVHRAGSWSAEPRVVRDLFTGMLADAHVTVQLHADVTAVQRERARVTGVTLSDGTIVTSQVVIDATETGDVIALSGAAYRTGNQTSTGAIDPGACVQSITYVVPIRKYATVPQELVISDPLPGYDAVPAGAYLPAAGYATTRHDAFKTVVIGETGGVDDGYLPWSWAVHNQYRAVPDSAGVPYTSNPATITRTSINAANDYPPAYITPTTFPMPPPAPIQVSIAAGTLPVGYLEDRDTRRAFDCAAKLESLHFLYYMQHDLGVEQGEHWSVADDQGFDADEAADCPDIPAALASIVRQLPPQPYIRESRRIVPLHTLTAHEIDRTPGATTRFHTAIARGFYAMDLHHCNQPADLEADSGDAAVPHDGYTYGPFEIPLQSLIPIEVDGLLPAEKNIGVSRLANGSTRLQGVTMLTGQASGTLAALAAMRGVQPREINALDLQRALIADGAGLSLTDMTDVPPADPRWADVQLALVRGAMTETAPYTFAPAQPLTRAAAAVSLAAVLNLDTSAPPMTSDFTDVATTDPAFASIEAVFHAGVTAGCGAGMFCPTNAMTRGQLAAFLARGILGSAPPACTSSPYPDVPMTDPLCPGIAFVKTAVLMPACSGGGFCPTTTVTRSEAATALVATMAAGHAPAGL